MMRCNDKIICFLHGFLYNKKGGDRYEIVD